ncbi:MAG TPA: hypothetical protein VL418_06225 [Devosiaceae bacterium]|nr:hypothetical protein [Devosiaceae bacterium]
MDKARGWILILGGLVACATVLALLGRAEPPVPGRYTVITFSTPPDEMMRQHRANPARRAVL